MREVRAKPKNWQAHARARGAVIGGLILFVLAQLGMGVAIEGWWPELRDPTFEIKYRQFTRLVSQHAQPPATVVFLGSSMTANGVNARVIEEPLSTALGRPVVAYNLGINGNGPLSHLIHVQRLLRRGIRPDVVCIEVAPLMCDIEMTKCELGRFPANVLEYRDLGTLERFANPPDLRTDWWQAHCVPIYGHRLMILNQSAPALVPFNERAELWEDADVHGWRPRPRPAPAEHRHFLSEVENEFKWRWAGHKLDEVALNALRELTDLLAKERITTLLVLMPEGPLMRSLYAPESAAPALREFAAISQKHGFRLVQANDWFGEESFRDSYHLNSEGATAFTERLLREAIAPTVSTSYASR